ncbi:hypothetical protein KAR91_48995 [Candidatus Pacearchaeota archaeon]|nr:hypothetical protein [Candidatus Pacearchaeota archaeon]
MSITMVPYKLFCNVNNYNKHNKQGLPSYLWKFTFNIIDIQEDTITIEVVSNPKFKTRAMWGTPIEYYKNELIAEEYILSKKLFMPSDISDFILWNKGDVF